MQIRRESGDVEVSNNAASYPSNMSIPTVIKTIILTASILALDVSTAAAEAHYYPHSPVIKRIKPHGAQQGTQTDLFVEGINLDADSQLLFSVEGVSAKVLRAEEIANEPFVTARQQLKVLLTVDKNVPEGLHGLRIATRYGTGNWIPFEVDRLPQVKEVEPNNGVAEPQSISGAVTILGAISAAGQQDHFRFEASAGDEIVARVTADIMGSKLDSVIELLDAKGRLIVQNNNASSRHLDSMLTHRFVSDGDYVLRIADRARGGGEDYFYRLTVGQLPYVTHIFPLGVRRDTTVSAGIEGINLAGKQRVDLHGSMDFNGDSIRQIRIDTPLGPSLNRVPIAVGDFAEVDEQQDNGTPASAQGIVLPITINGTVSSPGDQDMYRFHADRGQVVALEVVSHRLGTPFDSYIEVLDANGEPVPQAVLQALGYGNYPLPTTSHSLQIQRFESREQFFGKDFVFINDRELVRLEEAVQHADDYSLAQGLLGQRLAWLGTSPQSHPADFSAYRVAILEPDARIPKSDLPVFHLDYSNDDGGPVYNKDSYLLFTAPGDGDFLVRLRDLRGGGGPEFRYRLTARPARPDFRLFLDDGFMQQRDLRGAGARNPNVPRGGRVPLVVSVQRIDGFAEDIQVQLIDLPPGVTSEVETIRGDEFQATLVLAADEIAVEGAAIAPLKIVGRASLDGHELERTAVDLDGALNLISIVPPSIIRPVVANRQIRLAPGSSTQLKVSIECPDDFGHEVGIEVKNRPPGVFVPGRSTNAGLAIAAGERTRILPLNADPGVPRMTFPIYVVVRFRSEEAEKMRGIEMLEASNDYASQRIWVTIGE